MIIIALLILYVNYFIKIILTFLSKFTMCMKENNLNSKQMMFCAEYIVDSNATQAAIRAGYSEKSARESARRLMQNNDIREKIALLHDRREKCTHITAELVLTEAYELYVLSKSKIMKNNKYDSKAARNALDALRLVGNHIKINAFDIRAINNEVNDNTTITLNTNATVEEAAELYKLIMK